MDHAKLLVTSALQIICAECLTLPAVPAKSDWPSDMVPAPTSHDSATRALSYAADPSVSAADIWWTVAAMAQEVARAS